MIRRARIADAPAAHAILLAAKNDIPLADNFADEAHQQWVRDECRRQHVWLDERDGVCAGVMVIQVSEISYLAIDPSFRRRGVGRALVVHALAYMQRRRYGGATAKVRVDNTPIIALLESFGFAPHPELIATRPGWIVYALGDVR